MRVIVASRNPVKITATESAFSRVFAGEELDVSGIEVESGVRDQPMDDEETRAGAVNRANNAYESNPDAEYWVGLEGGVENSGGGMLSFAWMAIQSPDGRIGVARTGAFFLPPAVAAFVGKGVELGKADDIVCNKETSKQQNGAVGLSSRDLITRASYYKKAIVLALIPHRNLALYPDENN